MYQYDAIDQQIVQLSVDHECRGLAPREIVENDGPAFHSVPRKTGYPAAVRSWAVSATGSPMTAV